MKKKIFLILFALVIIYVYKINEQNIFIPDSSIRLRVIPNSNNPEDINIKEQVKNYLEKNVYALTKNTNEIEEARKIINDNIPNIKNNIDNIFITNSYDLSYDINYGYNYFPVKKYKGQTYNEGYYESLVISIGDANGDNWWCVLFPNFCLVDTNKEYEYKSYFKELLAKYSKK